jgi:uncharacterized protein
VTKRIWIDLDNSPHVPFFAPIIKELERRGYSVTLTARDAYQVCELADLFGLRYKRIGRHWGKNKALKVIGACLRSLRLMPAAITSRPSLALSHGSRSQVLASALLGIPSMVIMDYEFGKHSKLFSPTWMMVPEVVPKAAMDHDVERVLTYRGIKEDVYVPAFIPDPSIVSRLGLGAANVAVAVRPPASEAHYHNAESAELFSKTMEFLGQAANVKVIVLPRNAKQAAVVRATWPELFATGKAIIPERPEDGLNLIWHCDLVISGGGTMNREAAALGVPVYSIFRGQIGAVDRYLAESGRLTLLENGEDVRTRIRLNRRPRPDKPQVESSALDEIVEQVVALVESANGAHSREREALL